MSSTEKTVWDELDTDDIVTMLGDVQLECQAAIESGDTTLNKWARTTGLLATAVLDLLGADKATSSKPSTGSKEPEKHTDKPAAELEDKPAKK